MDNLPDYMCRRCVGFGKLDTVLYNKSGWRVSGGKEISCDECGGSGARATTQSKANACWSQGQGLGGLFG